MGSSASVTPPLPAGARFHEALALSWTDGYEARPSFRRRAVCVQRLLGGRVAAGSAWLDVGCGSGVFTRSLARAGARATGVDAAPAMLDAAQRSPVGAESAIRYQLVQTVEALPYPANSFDGVVCLSVLEYVDDPQAAIRELRRVLRADGVALMSVPNRWSWIRGLQRSARGVTQVFGGDAFPYLGVSRFACTRKSVCGLLRNTGFAIEAVHGFRGWPPGAGRWMPADLLFALARPAAPLVALTGRT
jgi:2-polyprenyl-6-hydroxyphenyl methylase/3-demethylubiquinone-9 3-methyltransferase